ncbi:hypothetical protein M9H77_09528 [Catharanthus roseus]|uniref:Uncharacterized protein n=1 Tax=Catharanthus roseus TaxID=4058 RepID=A0ACC0C0S8_CATRO|nr:hypothetical protein M9H77_09528 [Catharanthus roseus]
MIACLGFSLTHPRIQNSDSLPRGVQFPTIALITLHVLLDMVARELDRDDIGDATKVSRASNMIKRYHQTRFLFTFYFEQPSRSNLQSYDDTNLPNCRPIWNDDESIGRVKEVSDTYHSTVARPITNVPSGQSEYEYKGNTAVEPSCAISITHRLNAFAMM